MLLLKNKEILVFGLKRSGQAVIRLLNREGIHVTMTDDEVREKDLDDDLKNNRYLSSEEAKASLDRFDYVVKSPGIPPTHPLIQKANELGLSVISELEIAYRFFPPGRPLVAVTGTNGKTTVTTLITNLLTASGIKATSCGNIGYPLSEAVLVDLYDAFVCECSSFQLEGIRYFTPHVAVWLNVLPHHLDYHGSFEAYVSAKAHLFRNMRDDGLIVINRDDANVMQQLQIHDPKGRILMFSLEEEQADAYYNEDTDMIHLDGEPFLHRKEILLQGQANVANVLAALLVAKSFSCDPTIMKKVIGGFEPLRYRMEHIGSWLGVDFYNDSKSTNAAAMKAAIQSLNQPIILIAGGKRKDDQYEPALSHPNIKYVVTFGENRKDLKACCDRVGKVCFKCVNLLEAMRLVKQMMSAGDAVLFSPGAQSYDQYANYVERGEAFNQLFKTVIQF